LASLGGNAKRGRVRAYNPGKSRIESWASKTEVDRNKKAPNSGAFLLVARLPEATANKQRRASIQSIAELANACGHVHRLQRSIRSKHRLAALRANF